MKKWFKNKEGRLRSGWKIILAFGLMNILTGILIVPIILLMFTKVGANHISVNVTMNDPTASILMMLAQLLGVIITVWICLKLEKKIWRDVGISSLRSQGGNLFFGLFLGAISITFVTLIMAVTKQITLTPVKVNPQLLKIIGMYFVGFIFVAANEELFFRGYVISSLKQTKSYPVIYIVSCLIFGLAHTSNPNVHPLGILNIFLIGLLFTHMFIQTKSLWMSMGYHLTWNFFQGNIIGFNVSGTKGNGFFHIKESDNIWTGGSFGAEASIWTTVVILLTFWITNFYFHSRDGRTSESGK